LVAGHKGERAGFYLWALSGSGRRRRRPIEIRRIIIKIFIPFLTCKCLVIILVGHGFV
jgi:hypothetical protein